MIGTSYDGFTVLMALINPHPALKAAVPMSPMVDGWKGDDWFHNGAFRQTNFDYIYTQTTARPKEAVSRAALTTITRFPRSGSAGAFAKAIGIEQLRLLAKDRRAPGLRAFWRARRSTILATQPLKVPTMYVGGLWDQEDMYGGVHAYAATEPKDTAND